jgi:hypothetical protein
LKIDIDFRGGNFFKTLSHRRIKMKAKNSLKKLTLIKTPVAHLDAEQMTAARGGSCGQTWVTDGCANSYIVYPPTEVTCE